MGAGVGAAVTGGGGTCGLAVGAADEDTDACAVEVGGGDTATLGVGPGSTVGVAAVLAVGGGSGVTVMGGLVRSVGSARPSPLLVSASATFDGLPSESASGGVEPFPFCFA